MPPSTADRSFLGAIRAPLVRTLLCALLLTGTLAGCLGQEPEPEIRLTWWITYAEDSEEYPAFVAIAESFAEQAGTVVELVSVPWEDIAPRGSAAPRLSRLIESGEGPDLWGPVPHTWLEPYVSRNQALALDPRRIRNHSQYDDLGLDASRRQGAQYALPLLLDSVALIHNRALVPIPPRTFEQLVEAAREHTEPNSGQWGLAFPLLSPTHVYPFMDGYGGYIFGCQVADDSPPTSDGPPPADGGLSEGYVCDPEDIGLNNEGSAQGVQLISDLYVQEQLFAQALADRSQMHEQALQLFVKGQAAMLIDGPWVLTALRESEIDYGVARLPALPGRDAPPRPLTVVHGLTASAASEHPDQVLDLMNAIASPDGIARLAEALNKAPVRRDVVRQSPLEHARAWRDQAVRGVLLPPLPELDVVWMPWARALAEAVPGLRPVQEAMDGAVEQIKESLGQQDNTPGESN